MPEITRFLGLIITMFFDDHNPPHIHVKYGDRSGYVDIQNGEMLKGNLGSITLKLIRFWIKKHKNELLEMWQSQKIGKLPPLD